MRCLVLFLVLAISACAPKKLVNPSVLGRYNFAYELTGQKATGVIQVFDDGKKTYFQFAPGFREKGVGITRELSGKLLKTEAYGRTYLRVSTVANSYVVSSGSKITIVKKIEEVASES